jgi:hypothetical protein
MGVSVYKDSSGFQDLRSKGRRAKNFELGAFGEQTTRLKAKQMVRLL